MKFPRQFHKHILPLLLAGAAGVLNSCAAIKPNRYSTSFDPPLTAPTNPSAVRVKLSTGAQRVYVMEGTRVLLASPCSVGPDGTRAATPHGHFTIYSKVFQRRRVSEPGSGYPMTYWMEFKPAYGMHWGFVKPYPCTHGCVRLPIKTAKKMFSVVRVGTPIDIASSFPEDATVGKSLPVLDDGPMPDPPWSYMSSPQVFKDAEQGKFYTY
jgi:hypothetical protein